jgi:hypothetical protein
MTISVPLAGLPQLTRSRLFGLPGAGRMRRLCRCDALKPLITKPVSLLLPETNNVPSANP